MLKMCHYEIYTTNKNFFWMSLIKLLKEIFSNKNIGVDFGQIFIQYVGV